jgi:hypothetical protein
MSCQRFSTLPGVCSTTPIMPLDMDMSIQLCKRSLAPERCGKRGCTLRGAQPSPCFSSQQARDHTIWLTATCYAQRNSARRAGKRHTYSRALPHGAYANRSPDLQVEPAKYTGRTGFCGGERSLICWPAAKAGLHKMRCRSISYTGQDC